MLANYYFTDTLPPGSVVRSISMSALGSNCAGGEISTENSLNGATPLPQFQDGPGFNGCSPFGCARLPDKFSRWHHCLRGRCRELRLRPPAFDQGFRRDRDSVRLRARRVGFLITLATRSNPVLLYIMP